MCSRNFSPLLQPLKLEHLDKLNELYPNLPHNFLIKFLDIATSGINTELVTANTLLTIVDNLCAGETEEQGWRNGSSGVLFSVLSKDNKQKYQTQQMEILHDTVIPWLATTNARKYESLLNSCGIKRVFMHSCGESAFWKKDWSSKKESEMLNEQFLRTEIDYSVGTKEVTDIELILLSDFTPAKVSMVNQIIQRSEDLYNFNSVII